MITGIDPNATIDYVSKYDDSEPKTIWKLSSLTTREFFKINTLLSSAEKSLDGMNEIIKLGLKGYENFMGKTTNIIDDNFIDKVPFNLIAELSQKIIEISKLTEKQIKN